MSRWLIMLFPARSVLSVIVDFFPISMCYRTLGDKAAYFDFNTEKLQKHCCINYFIQGQDVVLKDYSEYPDWLEELLAEDSSHSLSPENYEYWRQLKKKDRRFERKRNFFRFRSLFVQRYYLDQRKHDAFN
ncbi:39S ribosomal protein L54, mitochondrial [Trichinella papuae]|uniref:39S ribosomal protein L54, mitochondrial n=1 Tax=Trichinella papuae TaxID=268474 RepID=A0A0V1M935_9BILA|nr:39S ribosomal protein L54, mitochondrial [Trichinella papuae]